MVYASSSIYVDRRPFRESLERLCRSRTLGHLGDLQGTSPGRHDPAGKTLEMSFITCEVKLVLF